ncbi:hybrid sensor histidine kinase/response regulator transcription factor [Fibrella aquatica]|uniref:hybrid sensor histidine kinase/response regulator transcription factor n=1 Tax=Fibrella aquatica TaxID=3242487 RepID=UPI0035202D66
MVNQLLWNRVGGVLLLVSLFSLISCAAQTVSFEHLTAEQGLSQNSVLAIAQDSRGFMWFGTRLGVNRYDGHSFKTYKHDLSDNNSLTSNYVISLVADTHKTLWVGTQYGLNRYNPAMDCFERVVHQPGRMSSLSSNAIQCLFSDKRGQLWVGTNEGLNLLTDRTTLTFRHFLGQGDAGRGTSNIRSIAEDADGNLWVGTANGLVRMSPGNGTYAVTIFRHDPARPGSLSDSYVSAISQDHQHTLWVGTLSGGLNRYDKATGTFTRFSHQNGNAASLTHNNIRKITTDRLGKLWIGTQEGLSILDPNTLRFRSYRHDPSNKKSLNKNSIYSIVEDAHGTIWIGTYYGGINVNYAHQTEFAVYQNGTSSSSISDDVVSSIIEDQLHKLWIATEGGGLNRFDPVTKTFTAYKHNTATASSLGSNLVKVVYQDRRGAIWAGTHGGGLNLFDPARQQFRRFLFTPNDPASLSAEILSVLEDSNGKFWVGTQSGLREFKNARPPLVEMAPSATRNRLGPLTIRVLIEDSEKNVWIGTSSGLFKHTFATNKLQSFDTTPLGSPLINSIREDAAGRIWVGTWQNGLSVLNKQTGAIETFTTKHGLLSNDVTAIVDDVNGQLWVSTGNGLSRFNPRSKTFINYTTSDGLPGNEFNVNAALRTSTGTLLFGGYQGVVSFLPAGIQVTKNATPIVFTALRLFNKPVSIGGPDNLLTQDISLTDVITFRHDQNVFSLDFALLNYIKSSKNKYAYKLEGFDKDWTQVSANSVTYTNLPAGSYTFWLKGANNDTVWSNPARLQITVLPPFWRTWWAYLFYAAVVAGMIVFAIRFFVLRALLARDHELHQVKLAFFTNISHEIRTHLTLIAGPIERLILARKEDPLVQQQLGYVQKDADRLLKLVTELMDFRKAETNHVKLHVAEHDLVPFLDAIYLFFREVARSKRIDVSFIQDVDSLNAYFDREQLEKVVFNLLSNAYKFTPEGGQITLTLEQQGANLFIRVIDNGQGIAPAYVDKLFTNYFQVNDHGIQNTGYGIGLALSKAIVDLHKGSLTVESVLMPDAPQNRTCFTVCLLAGRSHLAQFIDLPNVPASSTSQPPMYPAAAVTPLMAGTLLVDNLPMVRETSDVPALKTETILLVEDNPAVRAFVSESLAGRYQVIEHTNGRAGWEAAITLIPDLIISDVMMPEMDGFTLCNQLKTDERTSHIPVILLTARTATANQVSGLAMGADCYLTKPFSLQVLELHIRNLLASREKMRIRFSRSLILQPQNVEVDTLDEQFLRRVMQIIEQHMDDSDFDVDSLAVEVGMSRSVLYKKLKALTGMSVNDFVKSTRLKKATLLLQQRRLTVNEVAYAVGFNDRKYFSKEFKKQFGKAPSDYVSPEA